MMQTITVHSEEETIAAANKFAKTLRQKDVVLFYGDLGAGKSFFCRALIRFMAGKDIDVPSPTFSLVQTYNTAKGEVWHYDFYRIKESEEIWELGWEDAIAEGITLVEWPDRLGSFLPKSYIAITIKPVDLVDTAREITIEKI